MWQSPWRIGILVLAAWIAGGPPAYAQPANNRWTSLSQWELTVDQRGVQRLAQARESIENKKYDVAITLLQSLLDQDQDSFVTSDKLRLKGTSLKAEVERVLMTMPTDGQRLYEVQVGQQASSLLKAGLLRKDMQLLEKIERRFFATAAGRQASYHVGSYYLDQGDDLRAALHLDRLQNNTQQRPSATLALKTAIAWSRAGNLKLSREALVKFLQLQESGSLKFDRRAVPRFEKTEDALKWLNMVARVDGARSPPSPTEWTIVGGDTRRNASSIDVVPIGDEFWKQSTLPTEIAADDHRQGTKKVERSKDKSNAEDSADNPNGYQPYKTESPPPPRIVDRLLDLEDAIRQSSHPLLPAMSPLIVGELAIARTLTGLSAVNLKSGEIEWRSWQSDSIVEDVLRVGHRVPSGMSGPQRTMLDLLLQQKLWHDRTAGTISSDGKRVFAIEDMGMIGAGNQRSFRPSARTPFSPRPTNRLKAYDVSTGNFVWEVGGQRGDYELDQLAGSFFLGPPLPYRGRLYVLAEESGEVRLLQIDPSNGRIDWFQPLIQVEKTVATDALRRIAGLSPALAGGVLICPTGSGVVVAVDLFRRQLLWSYNYNPPLRLENGRLNQRAMARLMMMRRFGLQVPSAESLNQPHWLDSSVVVNAGRVIMTPIETNEIYCLDLATGQLLWKSSRGDGLFIAAIYDGKVVIIGPSDIRALDLRNGQAAWSQFTSISTPSGRGFRSGNRYHLPLQSGEVATIQLDNGRVLAQTATQSGAAIGNLVAGSGMVVAQNIDSLVAFEPENRLQERIAKSLNRQPDDADILALRGAMRLRHGKFKLGIADLRRSMQIQPTTTARQLLVRSGLEDLRLDFATHQGRIEETVDLIQNSRQRWEYLRLTAVGLETIGNSRAAFDQYLKLAVLAHSQPKMEIVNEAWSVRGDRWVLSRLLDLHSKSNGDQRGEFDDAVTRVFSSAIRQEQLHALRIMLKTFPEHAQASLARRKLIVQSNSEDEPLSFEAELLQIIASANTDLAAAATARLSLMLLQTGHSSAARIFIERLADRWADTKCLNGKTGRELIAEWRQDKKLGPEIIERFQWQSTPFVVEELAQEQATIRRYPVVFDGPRGPFFENWTLAIDSLRRSIMARDEAGAVRWTLNVHDSKYVRSRFVNSVQAMGHLLVISLGNRFLVVDTLHLQQRPKQSDTASLAPPDQSEFQPTLLWAGDLFDADIGQTRQHKMYSVPQFSRLSGRRFAVHDLLDQPYGTVVSVNSSSVCYRVGRRLYLADAATGRILWTRKDIERNSHVSGDDKFVAIESERGGRVQMIRKIDGKSLKQKVRLPAPSDRLRHVGGTVWTWQRSTDAQHFVLGRHDLITQRTLWQHKFSNLAKEFVINNEIVILEAGKVNSSKGRLVVVDLNDGRVVIESQVAPIEKRLLAIAAYRQHDQYVVLTQTLDPKVQNGPVGYPSDFFYLTHGPAFGVNRGTGKLAWSKKIGPWAIQPFKQRDVPLLVFANRNPNSKHEINILDTRSGEIIHSRETVQQLDFNQIEFRATERAIRVGLGKTTLKISQSRLPADGAADPKKNQ